MIFLGKIVKSRGNKGEVAVALSPDLDSTAYIFPNGEEVVLKSTKYQKKYIIEYFKEMSGICTIKFTGINSIDDALKLVGYSIYGTRKGTQNRQNNRVTDFIVTDNRGHQWGKVKDIETSGLNRILEVRDSDGEIIYVPFADGIVKKIDKEKKVILIDPPGGLKELNKK